MTIPPGGYLRVECDPLLPASILSGGPLNSGRGLGAGGGGVYLFNAAGQGVNYVEYGMQAAGKSIGVSGGQWRLLENPTPGGANALAAALGPPTSLRINEWMAGPLAGPDWLELANTSPLPVALEGLFLSNDPGYSATNQFKIPPLSFVAPGAWARFVADGDPTAGADHVNFSLSLGGESIRLYATNGALLDGIDYGPQESGLSEGRFPDAGTNRVRFLAGGTPGSRNLLPIAGVVLSEVILHPEAAAENGVEIANLGTSAMDLGGYLLTDDLSVPSKYRLPAGTLLPASGFLVVKEAAFGAPGVGAFHLSLLEGGKLWLLAADPSGALNGRGTHAEYRGTGDATSFIRQETVVGVDHVRSIQPTPGGPNTPAALPPVVVSELMIKPSTQSLAGSRDEYLELANTGSTPLTLSDPQPGGATWRLSGGVVFEFPVATTDRKSVV